MSNTSGQTTQQSKTRLIIGEIGVDTETGIIGKGHSYDNGKTFTVDDTIYGRIYHADDHGKIWQGIQDQVAKVVEPAKSAANSAVAYADNAIKNSRVNSQAIDDINSAVSDAKQGANDAMSRAKSAWDVATGAKEAVTDFDPLLKSAQSDASNAIAQIADTASALSDAKAAFTSDVAVAKNLANTAQSNADNAIKSASSVANDLTAVASQAKSNADGITKVTSDVGLLQTTVADNSGNISTIQETAKQIQQAVSDNAGNITVAKQTADSAVTVASDAKSNATVAVQTASGASVTAKNASGQAASAVLTANGAMTTASDAKSNATVAVQTASGASLTATNANSDATVAKQTASEAKIQASNAKSDFAQLSIRAGQIEASVANNSGAIASVQQTANGLTTTVADITSNGGGRNLLQGTRDFSGSNWLNLGTIWTKTDETYNGLSVAETTNNWDGISQYYQVKQGETYTFSLFARYTSGTGTSKIYVGFNNDENGYKPAPVNNGMLTCSLDTNWNKYSITFTANIDGYIKPRMERTDNNTNALRVCGYMLEKGTVTHDWSPAPEDLQNQFTQIKQSIDGVTTTINDPKTGLNATYQTAAGNSTTISNVKSDVYQLQTTANGLTSRVGNLESKTNTQETEIQQNKNAITLKADQTDVNTLKGNVTSLQSEVTTQANEITAKVTQSDVTGMLTGYATQDYTQSLVTQKANDWNLNLTNLKTDVNAIKTTGGGVNLANGTSSKDQSFGDASQTTGWNIITIATFDNPQAGQQYTISVNARNNGGTWKIQFWDGTSPTQRGKWLSSGNNFTSTQGQKQTATITWPSGSNKYLLVQFVNNNNGGQIVWNSAMLEEGTVAHTWSPAPSDMATVTSVTNLSATVDGIQAQVYNSDGSSKITQLSNVVQSKVSQGDYNSQINQLNNDINLRVKSADLISQINLQAGTALIQSNKLVLDAKTTVFTGDAFIPSAAIANLTADDITTGTLKGVDIDFRNSSGKGVLIKDSKITFDDGPAGNDAGYLSFSGIPIADWPAGTAGNELQIRYGESLAIVATSNVYSRALFSTVNTQIGYYQQGNSPSDWGLTGLKIDNSARHFNLGVWATDSTWARVEAIPHNIQMQANDAHAWLDGNVNVFHIYRDNDGGSATATKLQVDGWAWVRGWVEAAGHSQHSALSTKTDIQPVDDDKMLKMVNDTDLTTFLYKTDVANGETHRHIGPIIDDVHDVAQYQTPQDFIAPNGASRDDDNMIGALFGAVKALTKRIKTLESKVG